MRGSGLRVSACLAFALLAPLTLAQGTDAELADAAFEQGDATTALALYDKVLVAEPGNVNALVRSAMLLSWDRRFDEAVRRYDRALKVDPDNRAAALERAKVLSWSQRFPYAIVAFRSLLRHDPEDREARLGLARSLSWSGDQVAARGEYVALLERDPHDAEARVGLAQTYAWSGDGEQARVEYERALEARPDSKEAEMGLAYLDLEQGDLRSARLRTQELSTTHPNDGEVRDLAREVRRGSAITLRPGYERVSDTDDNIQGITRIEVDFGLPAGLGATAGYAHYAIDTQGSEGSIDSFYARLGLAPVPSQRLSLRAGLDHVEDSLGQSDDTFIGGVSYRWGVGRRLWGFGSAQRDTYRYSTPILDRGIVINDYQAGAGGKVGDPWRVEGAAGLWDLSDGNRRLSVDAFVGYRLPVQSVRMEAGYALRWADFREDLDNGYFDPSDFTAHLLRLGIAGRLGSKGAGYSVDLEGGVQSFTEGGVKVTGDGVLGGAGLVYIPVGRAFQVDIYAAHSDYALQSGTGFASTQAGVRLRYRFGD